MIMLVTNVKSSTSLQKIQWDISELYHEYMALSMMQKNM